MHCQMVGRSQGAGLSSLPEVCHQQPAHRPRAQEGIPKATRRGRGQGLFPMGAGGGGTGPLPHSGREGHLAITQWATAGIETLSLGFLLSPLPLPIAPTPHSPALPLLWPNPRTGEPPAQERALTPRV
ncbi:hypothetical protein mRhiFer1_008998 [Rhinolophus ferrumequinum]|uniref:Uncharacterized protein n=1 Tax=Rhinolophus ferrumequinum TaxID=59479 RepID=A0A7J7TDW3_RHIFE|nr:hypothetical protein mRhiFer1_008998 [Rhinolophus ferrumequinum]